MSDKTPLTVFPLNYNLAAGVPWPTTENCSGTDLQGVNQVLHQEEANNELQGLVDVRQGGVHVTVEGFGGQSDVHVQVGPSRRRNSSHTSDMEGEDRFC